MTDINAATYHEHASRSESNDYDVIHERLHPNPIGLAKNREGEDVAVIPNEDDANPRALRLLHAGMGIATEAGEFVDPLKKHIFYGKDLDVENLKEEMGDLLWYIGIACDTLGVTVQELMEANIAKLRKRYPEQFTEADALERKDKSGKEPLFSHSQTRKFDSH